MKTIKHPLMTIMAIFSLIVVTSCSLDKSVVPDTSDTQTAKDIPTVEFEKITLDNGLDVIFHIDRSDPVVAINLAVHVGSSRESIGKTGFAHLFEHLLFLDSENLGYGGLDEMNTRIGGEGTNGFTTTDMTQYFQAVPKDGLEKIIWAEADKLGWFINTVNQNVIDREKQVVKNEKRQRVDNRPYGHNFYVIGKAIYPKGHPYHHQVIGSLEDLENATLEDTKDFFNKWYKPDNVTVTITGDFDAEQAKLWVEKYFGEIPAGETPTPKTSAQPVNLSETMHFVHEDNFAKLPQLTMVWPSVEKYHPDSYALDVLVAYLTDGKLAPMNQVLIEEKQLTTNVSGFNYQKELAGEIYFFVNSKPNSDTDELLPAMFEAFEKFEKEGIPERALTRIKTKAEVAIIDSLQSALGKAIALGEYNVFTDNPGYLTNELQQLKRVSQADVMRVFETYIKDKHYVATSFVPKGQLELGLADATKAQVVEEVVVQGAEKEVPYDPSARIFDPTPSSFDRTVEPPFGKKFELPSEPIWRTTAANNLSIIGIQTDEIPLIEFSLEFEAGKIYAPIDKPGLAELTGKMLMKGAGDLDAAEFEQALGMLGSTLNTQTTGRFSTIRGKTLSRNLQDTLSLLQNMIMNPKFDEKEFNILKAEYVQQSIALQANPDAIAQRELLKRIYATATPLATLGAGTKEQIESITLEDVKQFHKQYFVVNSAYLNIVGDFDKQNITTLFGQLTTPSNDQPMNKKLPTLATFENTKVLFYDVPESKQSVLLMRRPAVANTDPDFARLEALNFPLGGIYTSKLMTDLRVNKGYTYGVRSYVIGNNEYGQFGLNTSVRTNVTKESIASIESIISNYSTQLSEQELAQTKDALLRGQALKNETLSDKLSLISEISRNGLSDNYRSQNMKNIQAMTLSEAKKLIENHFSTESMLIAVVGDANSQIELVKSLEIGEVELLNPSNSN